MNKEGEDPMFGHLQIKSAYSFQESTILIQSLIDNAKSKHIQALALTCMGPMNSMKHVQKLQLNQY